MAIALNTTRNATRSADSIAQVVPAAAVWDVPTVARAPRRAAAYGGDIRTLDVEHRRGHGRSDGGRAGGTSPAARHAEAQSQRGGTVLGAVFGAAIFLTIVFGGAASEDNAAPQWNEPQSHVSSVSAGDVTN